jgi:hypothetical protein
MIFEKLLPPTSFALGRVGGMGHDRIRQMEIGLLDPKPRGTDGGD